MKIAITGSSGFVGKHLIQKLRLLKAEIIEIDLDKGIDIVNWEIISRVGAFDVLLHLAAKSFVPDSFTDPSSVYNTNILGTLNVLELCKKYNARMIYISSYVYGNPEYLPIDENHRVNATNPYAQSKLIGEDLCKAYYRDFNVPTFIFRPFNIYGKGQNAKFLIPSIIEQAKTGKVVLNDSRPKRDFIYIDDIVNAYIKAIYFDLKSIEIVNLGSGSSTSVMELVQIIKTKMQDEFTVSYREIIRKSEVLNTVADISRAQYLLNWKPKISLEEGLSDIILDSYENP